MIRFGRFILGGIFGPCRQTARPRTRQRRRREAAARQPRSGSPPWQRRFGRRQRQTANARQQPLRRTTRKSKTHRAMTLRAGAEQLLRVWMFVFAHAVCVRARERARKSRGNSKTLPNDIGMCVYIHARCTIHIIAIAYLLIGYARITCLLSTCARTAAFNLLLRYMGTVQGVSPVALALRLIALALTAPTCLPWPLLLQHPGQ